MIIVVTGGRDYNDRSAVFSALDELHAFRQIDTLIHGAYRGVDLLAEAWAKSREVRYLGVPAKWKTHGDSAGPIRNRTMLAVDGVELVVAFPGGDGTKNCVDRARDLGIKVWEPMLVNGHTLSGRTHHA